MTNMMQDALSNSYRQLKSALAEALEAAERVANARRVLEFGRDALMLNGKLDGKNEAIREAQARTEMSTEVYDLEAAESQQRQAKFMVELARLDVEEQRAKLRLMELQAADLA